MMDRKTFLSRTLLAGLAPLVINPWKMMDKRNRASVQLLRHATLLVHVGDQQWLVDPMLADRETMDPVQNASNTHRIPMVDLPLPATAIDALIAEADAIVVTHIHRDHWDAAARERIPKDKPIICQPADAETIRSQGFTQVTPVEDTLTRGSCVIHRTGGQHGTGETGKRMGTVSGFVLEAGAHRIYIAGDTIWCDEVKDALARHAPTTVVLNAGAAQFLTGDPITMTPADVIQVCRAVPQARVLAVHMDTVNHCLVRRTDLQQVLHENNLGRAVIIPQDGEVVTL